MFISMMIIIMIIDTIIMYALGKNVSKIKGNMVLGTKLKASALDDEDVTNIVNKYKKSNNIYIIFSIVIFIPIFFAI